MNSSYYISAGFTSIPISFKGVNTTAKLNMSTTDNKVGSIIIAYFISKYF